MHLNPALLPEVASDIGPHGSHLQLASRVTSDARILRDFLNLHGVLECSTTRLRRDSAMLGFLAGPLRNLSGHNAADPASGREPRAIRRAQDYLNERFNQTVSLGELAEVANLSAYHFHRSFCRVTGMPPHAYQIHLRIVRAKALLRRRQPIAQVAHSTGFADQSHFTRHFKRLTGIPPARYAR
jgi:AraC-like DNA-binding protein